MGFDVSAATIEGQGSGIPAGRVKHDGQMSSVQSLNRAHELAPKPLTETSWGEEDAIDYQLRLDVKENRAADDSLQLHKGKQMAATEHLQVPFRRIIARRSAGARRTDLDIRVKGLPGQGGQSRYVLQGGKAQTGEGRSSPLAVDLLQTDYTELVGSLDSLLEGVA